MSLHGNLESFGLAEVFQSLALSHHTGTLRIASGSRRHEVYFADGEIAFVSNAAPDGLRLGEILARQGKVDPGTVREALEEKARSGARLGEALVARGAVTEADVQEALIERAREEIYDLFLLDKGTFRFDRGAVPEGIDDPDLRTLRLRIPPAPLIMEGLRRLDEWRRIKERIPSFHEILIPAGEADPAALDDEVRALLERVDGRTSLGDLFGKVPFGRFECCRAADALLEAGVLRPLEREECLRAAEAATDPDTAIPFLRCAYERDPSDAEIAVALAGTLREADRAREALPALERTFREAEAKGDAAAVAAACEAILRLRPAHTEALEGLIRSREALGDLPAATEAARRCAEVLGRTRRYEEAARILERAVALQPDALPLRVEAAHAWKAAGRKEAGIPHMEAVEERLEAERNFRELVKVLRWILDADPSRADIKHKINQIVILQARIERRRRRRLLMAGAAALILAAIAWIPISYEVRARRLFGRARDGEAFPPTSEAFAEARRLYERIVTGFGWSTVADDAQRALHRMARVEAERDARREAAAEAERTWETEKIRAFRRELDALHERARQAEARGDYDTAARICAELAARFGSFPSVRDLTAPVGVRTEPPGARILVDGKEAGAAPLVVRRPVRGAIEITARLKGFLERRARVGPGDEATVSFALERRAERLLRLHGPAGSIEADGRGRLYFCCRDGFLYAVEAKGGRIAWRRRIGAFADPPAGIALRDGALIVGSVDGAIRCVDPETGRVLWRVEVEGPYLATPAVSEDGRWVAFGDARGTVHLLRDGTPRARFAAEGPFAARLAFAGPLVVAASTDNFAYGLALPRLEPAYRTELPDDAVAGVLVAGDLAIVGCRDGTVLALTAATGSIAWARDLGAGPVADLALAGQTVLAWAPDGAVVGLRAADGHTLWRLETGARGPGSLRVRGGLGCAAHRGAPALLAFDPRRGAILWRYRPPAACAGRPAVVGGAVFAGLSDGEVHFLEALR